MKSISLNGCLLLLAVAFIVGSCNRFPSQSDYPTPPKPEKIPKTLSIHDHNRVDNYYWLNQRENPDVLKYLEKENEYTALVMQDTRELQDEIFEELKQRLKKDDNTVPYKSNGYYYYTKYREGDDYPVYCRKKTNINNPEEVLMDVNEYAGDFDYYRLTGLSVSPDNKLLAFGEDTLSRRKYSIKFKNLETGTFLDDEIPLTTGNAVWANDNKTVFYSVKDPVSLRSYRVYKHILGQDPQNDALIYEEKDETFSVYVRKSLSNEYIFIASGSTMTDEYRYLEANQPEKSFNVFLKRERGIKYSVNHLGEFFYIRTNMDGAKNYKLMKVLDEYTHPDKWISVFDYHPDKYFEAYALFNDFVALQERTEGLSHIRILNTKDGSQHSISFEDASYSLNLGTNLDPESEFVRYVYSSLTTPTKTVDYNHLRKNRVIQKQEQVLGDFSADNYVSERYMVEARDGKKVPLSLVYRKGFKKDGSHPALIYSYGSYGSSTNAGFRSSVISLLDRGFVYALAHIRGGSDLGREWYEDGKLLNKKNTFYDFIDCSDFLVQEKFTSSDKLFGMGGSAGGLLVGAVLNMRPELYRGIIAAVPFVDVVTTMLDESIPLTTGEYDEWGNPNLKEYYDYMLSYSPYDNVEAKDYPAILVTTGLYDSQVQYFEPAKWVAKLRELKTDDNILLLDVNMKAGHGGSSGRFERLKKTALEYAFMLKMAGLQ